MTCIYFSVSSKASPLESRILGESYVTHFFYPTSKSLANLYGRTHCKSGSGYTGRLGHACARPSRTAETKGAFGAKNIFSMLKKVGMGVVYIFLLARRLPDTNPEAWKNRMCSIFLISPQSLSQKYRTGHIANQDLATRGAPIPRMRAHRERQRRNAPSARKFGQNSLVFRHSIG